VSPIVAADPVVVLSASLDTLRGLAERVDLLVFVVSLACLVFVAPYIPAGFLPMLPALPFVAREIVLRRRWRAELRRLIGPQR
jgi:hypothetical protein